MFSQGGGGRGGEEEQKNKMEEKKENLIKCIFSHIMYCAAISEEL